MKQVLILLLFLICSIGFSQNMAKINYKDSCIMSGGLIKMSDLNKICKVCPTGTKKISGFILSYTQTPPLYLEQIYNGNRFDPKLVIQYAKPGLTFMFEEIKAINIDGKPVQLNRMLIGFKK